MMVYLLQHVRDPDGDEDIKTIGVYSSEASANEAIERARKLPGFCDHPDGFHIGPYFLDQDHWRDGFCTIYLGNGA